MVTQAADILCTEGPLRSTTRNPLQTGKGKSSDRTGTEYHHPDKGQVSGMFAGLLVTSNRAQLTDLQLPAPSWKD